MTAVIWVVVIVYLFGCALTAVINFIIWSVDRDFESKYEDLQEKNRKSARDAARRFRLSWAWPLMAASKLKAIMSDTDGERR